MKYADINKYIDDNNLLLNVRSSVAGIYCITINNYIAYIGQSNNLYRRCTQHLYNMLNATLSHDKKYELLLSAQLGGYTVDYYCLDFCSEDELLPLESEYIGKYNPPLNILTPDGKQALPKTIGELCKKLKFKINE